jgi:hypothetical protein
MPDIMGETGEGGSNKKMPTWVWLAVGGGALLLVLMTKGGSSTSSTQTDNLLAAELDAALKDMQAKMDAEEKAYQESQKTAWDDWKISIEELLRQQQGNVEPPSNPTIPPVNHAPGLPGIPGAPGGSESIGYIPGYIEGAMFDNYVNGFNYINTKRG